MSRVLRRVLLVCAAAVLGGLPVLAWVAAAPAAAQPATADVHVRFSRIDAVVAPAGTDGDDAQPTDGDVTLVVEVTNTSDTALTEVSGTLSLGARSTSRAALHRALGAPGGDGDPPALGAVVAGTARAGADVPAGATRLLPIETSLAELGLPSTAGAVHPVEVTVRSGSEVVGRVATAVVVLPTVDRPLLGGVLVRIDADLDETPAIADGITTVAHTPRGAGPVSLAEPDALDRLAVALAAAATPATVALDNALARVVPAADEVGPMLAREGIERALVPFAGADLIALHRGDLVDLAGRELRLGAAPWPDTDAAADPALAAPAAPVTAATVTDVLVPFGAEAIIVGEQALAIDPGRPLPASPPPVRRLVLPGVDDDAVQALVPDPWLEELLRSEPLDAAGVQRVLAETAVVHLERPGASDPRGVLLDIPGQAQPGGIEALLTALDDAPWIAPVTVSELWTAVAPAGEVRLDDAGAAAAALPVSYVEELAAAGASLTALQGVLTETGTAFADLADDLLFAASADFRDDLRTGRALIDDVRTAATDVLGAVDVVGEPTITFTDSEGQLPIVLANAAPVPLQVRIELSSRRLSFPSARLDVVLDADTTTTVLVDTEARTPGGTAPVDVTVTDPTGARQLASGTLVVRIAAYPLLALVLVGLSALVLVLWWVRDVRRRRQPQTAA